MENKYSIWSFQTKKENFFKDETVENNLKYLLLTTKAFMSSILQSLERLASSAILKSFKLSFQH